MKADIKNWYVLITKPRAEKQTGLKLTDIGIENFMPLHRELRQWADRKKFVEVPLFYNYLFVRTTFEDRIKVFGVDGLVKYLSIGGKAAQLTSNEIERVKKLCLYEGGITAEPDYLSRGDEVEIQSGLLCGLRGRLILTEGKKKIKITITGLGCCVIADIEKETVRKAIID